MGGYPTSCTAGQSWSRWALDKAVVGSPPGPALIRRSSGRSRLGSGRAEAHRRVSAYIDRGALTSLGPAVLNGAFTGSLGVRSTLGSSSVPNIARLADMSACYVLFPPKVAGSTR